MTRVFVLDNYDSFTFNLVQELGELGADPTVARNDAIDVAGIVELAPDVVVLSPGPGRPEDAGITCDVIRKLGGRIAIFGVCLGHQAIGHVFGAQIVRAPALMHGKTSLIEHGGDGVFAGLPAPFEATRYHSLTIEPSTLPDDLIVTARSADGVIMGVRHRTMAIEGVQFHPESILTGAGMALLANVLRQASAASA
jgi:anthranilate synthase component II